MEDASLAETALEAAGITFLATASAAFFAGTDIFIVDDVIDIIDVFDGCVDDGQFLSQESCFVATVVINEQQTTDSGGGVVVYRLPSRHENLQEC